MKIQCDVCNKDEASVFCVADEAALCEACDHRVHHANKLARKHQRFSLLHQHSPKLSLCDICQEKRAFLFCQQDRAILCRDCDLSIHKANEHTKNHNRYLLTGVKLSANSALYSSSTSPSSTSSANSLTTNQNSAPNFKSRSPANKPVVSVPISKTPTTVDSNATPDVGGCNGGCVNVEENSFTSSISEYLDMLPGWHVEDFLDSSASNGFFKIAENDVFPIWDDDLGSHISFSPESTSIWVPQAPPLLQPQSNNQQSQTQNCPVNVNFVGQVGFKDSMEVTSIIKSSRKWGDDNSFAVPQISPNSTTIKRSRTLL